MGRKRAREIKTRTVSSELKLHMRQLGFESLYDYQQWCSKNGFKRSVNKSVASMVRETEFQNKVNIEKTLIAKKREKNHRADHVKDVCRGRIHRKHIADDGLKRLFDMIDESSKTKTGLHPVNRRVLSRLMERVVRHEEFFDMRPVLDAIGNQPSNTYLSAFISIARFNAGWIRNLDQWQPKSHNTHRLFLSLVRHLFVLYEMPSFFESIWFMPANEETIEMQKWYLHVGLGKNLKNCNLPIPYTKKMAHNMMCAPSNLSIHQAIRYGQVIGLRGNKLQANAIVQSILGRRFENEEFWKTVIEWFIQNPEVHLGEYEPIMDYIQNQKYVSRHEFVEPGVREELPPPQPDFSMKGRSSERLRESVQQWHAELSQGRSWRNLQWEKSGIGEFEFQEGSDQSKNVSIWTIRELLNSKSLSEEGKSMNHCVASYSGQCVRGTSSIWTLERESFEGTKKVLTIEVQNSGKRIVQVRGKANRLANQNEFRILSRWAQRENLNLPQVS